jgi:alpha-L-arabinofuranosidase
MTGELRFSMTQGLMLLALSLLLGAASAANVAHADPLVITIDARNTSDPVTRYEYGMFIEPIGGVDRPDAVG